MRLPTEAAYDHDSTDVTLDYQSSMFVTAMVTTGTGTSALSPPALPERAQTVIVGGGIVGVSVLYHLAAEGCTDTVLIEKAELTSGSTWHAAGQITHSVSSYTLAKIRAYGTGFYAQLDDSVPGGIGWRSPGSLRVAYEPVEEDWLKGQLGVTAYAGLTAEWITPPKFAELHPFYDTAGILGAIWTPHDGYVDPARATGAMADLAKQKGAVISRRNRVTDIVRCSDGSFNVVTEKGTVHTENVVNAAGCYAHRVARMVGLDMPAANALHTYLVTEPVPAFAERARACGAAAELPVVRDDYVSGYIRQDATAGLVGVYEQNGAEAAWHDGPGWGLESPLFEPDYDRIGLWLGRAFQRMPILADIGIAATVRGAISHTPDGEPLLGPSGVPGFWMACGVQVGVADGPGLGRELARWMVHGATDLSVRAYDARRFGFLASEDAAFYGRLKGVEDYQYRHQTPLPGLERPACRPYRGEGTARSASLYERLSAKGAVFTQVYGWERPKWFPAAAGLEVTDATAFRRTDWFEPVREEVRAVRERVGVIDLSAFAKFDLTGPDAARVLDAVTTNRLPAVGRIALTYLLTPAGRVEGEMTITRLAEDRFYLVSAAVGEGKDREHFETHWPRGADAELRSRSTELGVLALSGPSARHVLRVVTDAPVGNREFPWLTARVATVAGVPGVRLLRVGFTGSLGWEIHAPLGELACVYDALWAAGEPFGITDFGNHALNSLRLEKAYRVSAELTHDVSPDEAGIGRFVKPNKGDFTGRRALLERRARVADGTAPRRWALVYLEVHSTVAEPLPADAVLVGGQPVGLVTSGGYGYTAETGLAFAYVSPHWARPGTKLEVSVLGEPVTARVLAEAVYDPANRMLRS